MKKRELILVCVVILLIGSLACTMSGLPGGGDANSGAVIEEERTVSGFTGVTLTAPANLYVKIGDEEQVVVEAEDSVLEDLVTEVRGNMLHIESKDGASLTLDRPVKVYLTVESLDTVVLAGNGDIELPELNVEEFTVNVSGSGDIEVESLNATTLTVEIAGSGDLDAAGGRVDTLDVSVSGSGKYDARHLQSRAADVKISGSGSTTIWATESLQVTISGSGSVRYVGNPNLEKVSVSGTGTIEQIEQ